MGQLRGHGVRFGFVNDVMAAGEGIETMLSLRCALPQLPMIAALSRPAISRACRFPRPCAASTSRATMTPPATTHQINSLQRASAAGDRGDRPVADARRLQRRPAPSAGSPNFVRRCEFSSPRMTSSASCRRCREQRRGLTERSDPRCNRRIAHRGLPFPERAAPTAFKRGGPAASDPAPQRRAATIFRRALKGALQRETK